MAKRKNGPIYSTSKVILRSKIFKKKKLLTPHLDRLVELLKGELRKSTRSWKLESEAVSGGSFRLENWFLGALETQK
ncbi:hypothetical protein A7K93_06370 [Candidatus Methylacidiphilum fumarolicum]|nr:hypothetical protein A7K73_09140 [Candidatus Methylacidiphilum fumarolicum]TFE73326.1 hypothetical protein A7K93_06370 [Candidatus Methylacidiphilum fumarolicum]TFE74107.1 hypothetical protein A7K72_04660 [Candidatus Methylacidiphilum fumarolicum]TFE77043.1 hypothetical protein A7D33_06965 [Candidatus Methylacidiphilum fumarolicum]